MEEEARIVFGDYKPDLPLLLNDGLIVAKNVVPIHGGYDGIGTPTDLASFNFALLERPRGAIAGIDPRGNPYNFVGTQTKLYALLNDGTTTEPTADKTRTAGGPYNCGDDAFWEAAVFGSAGQHHIVFCNPGDDTQFYTYGSSTNFAQLGNPLLTNTKAPRASHIGIIGTFVVLGDTFDPVNGQDDTAIHWSAVNDPFNWPAPGTEAARAVQSDRQPLSGDGGSVQRVVSGAEVAAIFQERSIWRADYRGGDVVFELNRVEPNRGCLIPAIAIPFGRHVFYLSEDGFYLFDYTESIPIGREIVDKTFLADIDSANFHRVSAIPDPDKQRLWILYPGAGNTAGRPNKFLVYDWALRRFSHGERDLEWLTWAINAGASLDSPGIVGDPNAIGDDPLYPDGGIDGGETPPTPTLTNFDVRVAAPGALKLGAYSTTFRLQDFSGAGLPATLETGRRELSPGSRALVTKGRPIVDSADPTMQVAGIGRTNETAGTFTSPSRINKTGFCPLRKDARYHSFRTNLPTGFSAALGTDVHFQKTGAR